MSKVGRLPISIPSNVTVTSENGVVTVKGPKGELTLPIKRKIEVTIADNTVNVARKSEAKPVRALHGTTRNLINNMIKGVSEGFSKTMELVGTGYRVALEGKNIKLSLGYSHPIVYEAVDGITFAVEGQNKLTVSGFDRQLVGQTAANIRRFRPPEPYKGKGIRYEGEVIVKKAGKTSKGE